MSGVIMYDVIKKLLLFLVRNSYWLKKQTISKAKWKIFFHSSSSNHVENANITLFVCGPGSTNILVFSASRSLCEAFSSSKVHS